VLYGSGEGGKEGLPKTAACAGYRAVALHCKRTASHVYAAYPDAHDIKPNNLKRMHGSEGAIVASFMVDVRSMCSLISICGRSGNVGADRARTSSSGVYIISMYVILAFPPQIVSYRSDS
jgi:hypothetical protein